MSRLSSFLVAILIIAGSVALASFLVSRAPEPERVESPPQIPYAQTGTVIAGSGAIPVYGAGTVRPGAEVDIAPQVGGRITWVDAGFQSGGRVQAGQAIFRIEEADYLYRVQEAEANLAARRVALLEEQEQAAIARAEYERYSNRLGDGAAQTGVSPLTLREPQLEAARAELKRAEALLADARLALSRTRVTAPFDGHVREESVDAGQIVMAGQTVGRLFASDAVEVVVPLSDGDAALIPGLWELEAGDGEQGVQAIVAVRYGAGKYAWKGYVDRGETSVDELTRTIDVVVRVPDPFSAGIPVGATRSSGASPPLLLGEFVEVEITGVAPENFFRAPRAALQPGNELWVVNPGGKVSIVPVRVLQRADDEVFVTGGLEGGQAVITSGIQFATEGMLVSTKASPIK
ncbi:MAG: efflux RND transporter periplasmic adaptor subunit [Proteobacteria bacterium]|nr:efflux RND transporter periplasmic adaptor subunit [Pseudomonadota bacterium]